MSDKCMLLTCSFNMFFDLFLLPQTQMEYSYIYPTAHHLEVLILIVVFPPSTPCLSSAPHSLCIAPSEAHLPCLSPVLCLWCVLFSEACLPCLSHILRLWCVLFSKACLPCLSPVLCFWHVLFSKAHLHCLSSALFHWCVVLIRSCCVKLSSCVYEIHTVLGLAHPFQNTACPSFVNCL